MRPIVVVLAVVLALVAGGCKKDSKQPPAAGSDTTAPAPTPPTPTPPPPTPPPDPDPGSAAAPPAGSGSDAAGEVAMKHGGGNCPSMVFGSTTKAARKDQAVLVTITATDKDAIAAIQKRTTELLSEKADGVTSGAVHDQKGTHGGGTGRCPIYWPEGGKATSKAEANGVVVTITPKDKPDELLATIEQRIAKAAEWVKDNIKPGDRGNQGGVGGGKGEHGSTHQGAGDGKGKARGDGKGGGAGTGGGGGKGTGGGGGKDPPKDKGGW